MPCDCPEFFRLPELVPALSFDSGDCLRCRIDEDSIDENKALFQRAIDADPSNGPNLAAFASYLSGTLGQNEPADVLFRRAIECNPQDADIIGTYASFVAEVCPLLDCKHFHWHMHVFHISLASP